MVVVLGVSVVAAGTADVEAGALVPLVGCLVVFDLLVLLSSKFACCFREGKHIKRATRERVGGM